MKKESKKVTDCQIKQEPLMDYFIRVLMNENDYAIIVKKTRKNCS